MARTFRSPLVLLAAAWLAVALTVLLVPSPREWVLVGNWLSPRYDRIAPVFEPVVHITLMASIAVLLMHGFRRKKAPLALVLSLGCALSLAAGLEGLQYFLPARFGRQCDIHDLIPALVGSSIGCLIGLSRRRRGC